MANLQELRQAVQDDYTVRERLFQYHYANDAFGPNVPAYQARTAFEQQMATPANADLLIRTYLPEHNRQLATQQARPQTPAQPQPTSAAARNKMAKCYAIGAAGALAFVLSFTLENEVSRDIVKLGGATVLLGAAAGGLINKIKE